MRLIDMAIQLPLPAPLKTLTMATLATPAEPTYFWSGSNCPGEIRALAKHGRGIGVSVNALDKSGHALASLVALAADVAERIVANVTHARGGRPIVMLGRNRAQLPTGDTSVQVNGESVVLGFRSIAVNVARSVQGGANVLASLLRGMFGESAGGRGEGHQVAFVRTLDGGWQMSDAELEAAVASGSKVFVDSGAFGEVDFNAPHKCGNARKCRAGECVGNGNFKHPAAEPFTFVDVNPITDADWQERLAAYATIAGALGERAYLVAPDKVGDQAETLRRLTRYAPQVRALRAMGANIIVPMQLGAMTGGEFDRACSDALGFNDYVRGIPSKKAAATPEQIAALSADLPADARVHLLGLGPAADTYEEVVDAIGRDGGLVFCDSVRLRALVGHTNGPGGGPRILTELTTEVRLALGLTPRGSMPSNMVQEVKFRALDAFFAGGHA